VTSKIISIILGVLAGIVPIIYVPGIFDFARHPRLFMIQLFLLLGCFLLAIANKPPHISQKIYRPLICWTSWTLLSTLWAINPIESLIQAQRIVIFSLIPLIFCTIRSQNAVKSIYAMACFTGAIVSIIGICQYFGWAFNTLPTVGNPSATFGYRNFAASYLVVLLPATTGFALSEQTHKKIGWGIAAVLMAIFLAYTRTRGAWLGFMVATLIAITALTYLYMRHQTKQPIFQFVKWPMLVVIFAVVCMVGLIPDQMQQTGKFKFDERKTDAVTALSTAFSPSDARGRLIVWQHTLEMVRNNPLVGVGLGSWQYEYPKYDKGDWITNNTAPQRPHNDLLWILSETGVIGLGLFLWLLFVILQMIWQKLKHPTDITTLWMLGIGVGLLAFVGHSFFSFPQERPAPSLIFWMGIGAIANLAYKPNERPLPFRVAYLLAIPLLFCGLILSYHHIQFDKFYLQAHSAWRQQNWQQLLSATNQARQWGPLNYRIYLLKGAAHQQLGQLEEAIASYQNAQQQHPNEGHAALGSAYLANKNYDLALKHLRIEHALYPNAPQVKADLANALLQVGTQHQIQRAYTLAQASYQEALSFQATDPRIYNNLGSVMMAQKNFAQAEIAFLEALKRQPDYARVYHNLGDLYTLQKDTSRAIDAYQQFISKWQGDPQMIEIARKKIIQLTLPQ
jgi:O-antigen ligase/Flp pilus assembly protein TadD